MRRRIAVVVMSKRLLSCNVSDEHIRKAQASEVFRYAYYNSSKSNNNTISVSDIDDLVSENRVRPSILLNGYELLGSSIGLLSKIAPSSCTKIIDSIVEDATTQQFNDSLRSLGSDTNEDIKLTFKIHRDFNSNNDGNINTINDNTNGKILTGLINSRYLYYHYSY